MMSQADSNTPDGVPSDDAAASVEQAIEEAANSAEELKSAVADPANPVEPEMDAKTAAALKAAQDAIASMKSASAASGTTAPASSEQPAGNQRNPDAAQVCPGDASGRESVGVNGSGHGGSAGAMFVPPSFQKSNRGAIPSEVDLLADVNLNVKIELGRTRMFVEDVLKLNEGAVVELDKAAGDPVDIFVNDRHVARGEVLVINDCFCVRVSEILATPVPE